MENREYYEEFSLEGKNIIYIDLSHIKAAEEFSAAFEEIKPAIAAYPENSLYTITNLAGSVLDTFSREAFIKYIEHNKPYVKKASMIGLDGVAKMAAAKLIEKTGRDKFHIAFTKEKAIEWILQQD